MRLNRRLLGALSLPLLAAGTTAPGEAQEPGEVEIRGTVVDVRTGDPIAGATVLVTDSWGDRMARLVTGEEGEFTADVRHRAAARLEVGATSYETVVTPLVPFRGDDLIVVEVTLDPETVALAPVEVVATAKRLERSPLFEGFDHRRERGLGSFVTREEIEEREPPQVSDLLRELAGIRVSGGGAGHRQMITMERSQGRPCPVQIYLDGVLMTREPQVDVSVDDLAVPGDLEGMEVYRGLATVPAEFLNPSARCGVVALWTRRGGPER